MDMEWETRELAAAQHDADMVDKMQCRKCEHIGLRYTSDDIGGEFHVYADCPECGARREV